MEIQWFEAFISSVDTQSFSRSARERNITQPAFGRRIRALESRLYWLVKFRPAPRALGHGVNAWLPDQSRKR